MNALRISIIILTTKASISANRIDICTSILKLYPLSLIKKLNNVTANTKTLEAIIFLMYHS